MIIILKSLFIFLFLSNFQKVLANEKIKGKVLEKRDVKYWIKVLQDEIREVELKENGNKDWIEDIKEEIKELEIMDYEVKEEIKSKEGELSKVSEKRIFEEIGTGLSDKGIYIDFIKNINAKNKFGIRVNYLPEDFITHQDIYIDNTNVKTKYFGIGALYQHFLLSEESRSNFYLQANTDISTFKLSHDIDLTKETYTHNNLEVTCSACGILTIQTDPDKVYIIPNISFGYQYKINSNFKTNLSIGVQYINPGSLENFTNTTYNLPSYVQSRVDDAVQKTQDKIDKYSKIQPSINVGFSYSF